MPQKRSIRVIQARPPGVAGASALDDLALITLEGLKELGHAVERVSEGIDPNALNILIGGHLLDGQGVDALPSNVVVYNAVPIPHGGLAGRFPAYARLLARNPVWDVSKASLDALAEFSSRAVSDGLQYVPPGWVPALARIPMARTQDIGILYIGPVDRARWRLLADLEAQGHAVRHVAEVSGTKRDSLVARARLVLDLAPMEDQPPEPTRLVYLLANRKAVLAETNTELEDDAILRTGVRLASFDELTRACQRLGNDIDGRLALAQRGLDAVRRRDAANVLKQALARLPVALRTGPSPRTRGRRSSDLAGAGGLAAGQPPGVSMTSRAMAAMPAALTPTVLNLNGGRDPVEEAVNLDFPGVPGPVGLAPPDVIADPCAADFVGRTFDTGRFGTVVMAPASFGRILAPWVLSRVHDLTALMTACLILLAEDGALEILVPYDLSHGAWADPASVRAFNEHAFTAFTEGHAAIGWTKARFHMETLEFAFTALGERLEADGTPVESILATPRAVDAMRVVLRKRAV